MQTIYIDISNKSVLPTIYAKQGDVGRKFKAVISNSGVAYQITSESFTASYDGASGSGNYDQIEGRSAFEVSKNTVVVELAPNIFQAPGDSLFCLTMKNGDDSVIGLWNIPIYTEEKPGFLGDPIGDYYPGISAVLYVDQSLDSKQKEKARKNVGAVGYEKQHLSKNEKVQARENIGAADYEFVGDSAAALDAVIEMQEALLNASGTLPDDYGTPYAVEYIKQKLTEVAKAQARENIGAAPAGYGYGETLKVIDHNVEASFETLLNNELATMDDKQAKQIAFSCSGGLHGGATYFGTLTRNISGYAVLYGCSADNAKVFKSLTNGVWNSFEWENPPMVLGNEYKTTERWQGKAVYTKMLNVGAFPGAGTVSYYGFGDDITKIIKINGAAANAGFAIPFTSQDESVAISSTVYQGLASIVLYVEKGDFTDTQCIAQVWYTKD